MKTPRLIILFSALSVLALTLVSCASGPDTGTTATPPPPRQQTMGGY